MKHFEPSKTGYASNDRYAQGIPEGMELTAITCDICGITHDSVLEWQEYLCYSDSGGYSNRWIGDLTSWEIDMCQDCVGLMLGPYVRVLRY